MLDLLQTAFTLDDKAHWYPLIWLFLAGIILYMMPQKQELVGGRVQLRWHSFSAILLVLPLILWAGLRGNVGDRLSDNYEQKTDILMNKRESCRKQRSFLLFLFPC